MPDFARRSLSVRFAWRSAVATGLIVAAVGVASLLFWLGQVEEAITDGVAGHLDALEAELDLASVTATGSAPVVLPTPEQFVQVVTPEGRVVMTSSELSGMGPVVSPAAVLAGAPADYVAETADPRFADHTAVVMARSITTNGDVLIGIVGASLDPADQARSRVLVFLLIGVPLLSLLVGWGVWLAVTYALRPVTELAMRADEVAQGAAPWRLDVNPEAVELQSLAESLDGLLDHLRAAFESERRFLDDASHELRTPIAVARGELDLLQAQLQDDPELAGAVGSAIEEIDRLDRLAADLLLLARARGTHHHVVDCDLAGLARRATGTVMREPGQRDVEVRVRGDARADGDEHALERVLRNTIANAVSNCTGQVSIDIAATEDEATIVVSDDGPGFPDEMTGSSFPRFATGRGRRSGGTGLGLAIAAAIVEAHRGRLVASNQPEGGARVTIRIPRESGNGRRGGNGRRNDRLPSMRSY